MRSEMEIRAKLKKLKEYLKDIEDVGFYLHSLHKKIEVLEWVLK